jgi:hypothetical protein
MARTRKNRRIEPSRPPLQPYWKYEFEDKTTWKYIDCVIGGSHHTSKIFVKQWILNPDFKYKHLDPNYGKRVSLVR